jgi:hypothetical protein
MSNPRARLATAEPDDPERRSRDLARLQLHLGPRGAPTAGADEPVAGDDTAAGGEDERHREVRCRRVEDTGRVRHCDAARRTRCDVDSVVADAVVRDQPERRIEVEVDGLVHDHEHVDVGPRPVGGPQLDLRELLPGRAGKRASRPDLHGADATTLSA